MVTTRRASTNVTSSTFDRGTAGGVDVLERKVSAPVNEFISTETEETVDQARARMRGNLDLLLNYDRYSEQVVDSATTAVVDSPVEQTETVSVEEAVALQDEDIRPTSTTMQFGDGDVDQMYKEMNRSEQETNVSYRLNGKGKLVVVLYALAVTVILALIVINTGVLASLSGTKEAKTAELNSKIEQYQVLKEQNDYMNSEEYIIQEIEKLDTMVKG